MCVTRLATAYGSGVGTGLIYGAIVVIWAAFLVPWALRRYDEASHTRSIESFSTAMRVLGRSDQPRPAVQAAAPPAAAEVNVRPARTAAARRRWTLLVLLVLTVGVAVLGVLAIVPLWLVIVPATLIGAFLVVCRRQVRRADEAGWIEQREASAQYGKLPGTRPRRAARIDSAYGGLRPPAGDPPNDDPTVVLSEAQMAAALVETDAVVVPVATSDGTSLWDPLPVTLPTYVSKPRVPRTIRNIDLGEPGTWTSGHLESEPTALPQDAEQGDEAPEDDRAVGT